MLGRVLRKRTGAEIRAEIEKKVVLDLMGPAGGPEEEVTEGRVRDRYLVGVLAPRGQFLMAEENDRLSETSASDDEDGRPDDEVPGREALLPSSMGLSFCVDGQAPSFSVTARWGRYVRTKSETLVDEKSGQPQRVWKRVPVEATSPPIALRDGRIPRWCGRAADPWMTVVGYFNSIRELGGMRRLLDDDIASRLKKMDRRGLAVRRIRPTAVEELTSRKGSTDIPAILDRLEVPFDPEREAEVKAALKKGKPHPGSPTPLDVVLATNMVSVGVDVQRLGLMVVCGQPKTAGGARVQWQRPRVGGRGGSSGAPSRRSWDGPTR